MYGESKYAAEAPTWLHKALLLGTALACVLLVAFWAATEPTFSPRDPLLAPAVGTFLFAQWLALGLLLRPRGQGLRRSVWARLVAATFGATHLLLGLVQTVYPIERDPVYQVRATIVLYVMGGLIIGAAAQAHWAAAGGPSGTGRGTGPQGT